MGRVYTNSAVHAKQARRGQRALVLTQTTTYRPQTFKHQARIFIEPYENKATYREGQMGESDEREHCIQAYKARQTLVNAFQWHEDLNEYWHLIISLTKQHYKKMKA